MALIVTLTCVTAFALLATPYVTLRIVRQHRFRARNFRNEWVPQGYGLVIVVIPAAVLSVAAWLSPAFRTSAYAWLTTLVGVGALGFLDDLFGDKRTRGIVGHLGAAARGRLSTGFIKAVGIVAIAAWVAHRMFQSSLGETVLATAVIALCANAMNLFDLRPGRALAVFAILGVPCLLWAAVSRPAAGTFAPLASVMLAALPIWPLDARGQVMMGDVGSNTLGAALGLALIQTTPPGAWLVVTAALAGLHLAAERTSFSDLVDRHSILRRLDRLTGVR